MRLFDIRFGPWRRSVWACIAVVMLSAGCADPVADSPLLTGNTFDRYNSMAVAYPESENVNISYEYGFTDETGISAQGDFSGRAWLFSDNSAAIPERFVILHLVEPDPEAVIEVGRELSVGKGVFTVKDYCVTLSSDAMPARAEPYVTALLDSGFALSQSLFVRRFVSTTVGLDGKRLDVVFIEDIVRKGYDCNALDDMDQADGEIADFIGLLRARGDRSFEVVG